MKRLFIISVIALVLSGCSLNTMPSQETPTQSGETIESIAEITNTTEGIITNAIPLIHSYEPKTISGDVAEDVYLNNSKSFEGCVLLDEEERGLTDYDCKKINGYVHTYQSPELGIKITYDENYDFLGKKLFFAQNPIDPIKKHENIIFDVNKPNIFIKLIEKNPNQTPQQIMEALPKQTNCIYTTAKDISIKNDNITIYAYQEDESNAGECYDENYNYTEYIFSKTKSEYYYQKVFSSDCAPGPCNALEGTTELFLK
ncbi:hypothetical protein P148_SR1C00001G0897 [candidate division SR1 bacterium RAAC1_SR1_1]|nr:hypothetical protein P148_SR1C00001G0897 [candidate division SR1 bacterium RAAC1_SR1_1]